MKGQKRYGRCQVQISYKRKADQGGGRGGAGGGRGGAGGERGGTGGERKLILEEERGVAAEGAGFSFKEFY